MAKTPGPVPAPEGARRRRNKPEIGVAKGTRRGRKAQRPTPKKHWRKDVRDYFASHFVSGQSDFYEQSDVMALTIHCELLDRVLRQSWTYPVFERDDDGNLVYDADGNKIPVLDENGEQRFGVAGKLNGQSLKAILDQTQDLLTTEGARRRLKIDLGMPSDDSEAPEERLIAQQRVSFAAAK